MRTALVLAVACLFLFTLAVAPTASARPDIPPGGGNGSVCVPGLTFCCYFYNDGDVTPAIYCL